MKCDLCGNDHGRRKRRLIERQVKMLCFSCWWELERANFLNTVKELMYERKQWSNLKQEYDELKTKQTIIAKEAKQYPYSNPWSAVPPAHVIQNVLRVLKIQGKYDAFPEVFGDYYGIKTPPYGIALDMVPENAIACYYPSTNKVYSKTHSMSKHTALHEMWHALERHGIVPKTPDSEKNANIYAEACLGSVGISYEEQKKQ